MKLKEKGTAFSPAVEISVEILQREVISNAASLLYIAYIQ